MWLKKTPVCVALLLVANTLYSSEVLSDTETSQNFKPESSTQASLKAPSLTLNKIMADPDWMGNSPTNPRWSIDGKSVFYAQKATGHQHSEHFKINLAENKTEQLLDKDGLYLASQQASLNTAETLGVFAYQGDIYLLEVATGEIKALTADDEQQSKPQFSDDYTLSYFEGRNIFLYDLNKGFPRQIASFKTEKDPDDEKSKNYLEQSQPRLLDIVKNELAEKNYQKQRAEKARLSNSKTWYLGENIQIRTFRLSPDGNWLVLGTVEKLADGKADNMPEFVTADGYVNNRKVRPLVGSSAPQNETFYLLDLVKHEKYQMDTSNLPGINDDPLASFKKKAAKKIGYKYKAQQGPRAIYAYQFLENEGVAWSENSQQVAINLFSYDNKDRWIVGLDVNKRELKTLHWMSDDAWVNDWTFNEFGWLPGQSQAAQTLYYLSEEDGYSHIYIKKGKRRARQLTEGKFEVSNLTASKDGQKIYFKANKKAPGIYETYRVAVKSGHVEALTDLNGVNDYVLSPSQQQLLIRHSTTVNKPELYLQTIDSKEAPVQLTSLASEDFKAVNWQQPEIVKVPSSEIKRSIYARHYTARSEAKVAENNKKPAVIFVHGAGYLQNSHQGWSGYFREFMFHNMLTQQGYEVLDMDFRASKGYGRDWRTAIYRQMGTPELADLKDGVNWLVENANVDPARVGVYGGSYGGFMTFMSLFKAPDLFAAGAALRPVTDWAHYNHGYTSNILNTPQVDPDAYERSSPIEFAEGLKKPLLIAHGMVDDNVFFKDSVRLVQRLIELEKTEYFETAIYPVEPHSFRQPSSWLDEYTRIYQLFEKHLN